jgi:hypothetical protein
MFAETGKDRDMPTLPTKFITLLSVFSSAFSRPVWENLNLLLSGAILCRGPRRMTSILPVLGLEKSKGYSKYYRLLSHAKWNGLSLSKILLDLLIDRLPDSWPLVIVVDETVERQRIKGDRIQLKSYVTDDKQACL